jgi:Ca2+-binding RTX toxin-like protein
MKPNDPYYTQQWHFKQIGDIEKIWDEYNGAGVHVGVYDLGIDYTNPDLKANYDASRRISYNGIIYSGLPNDASAEEQNHGTPVTGLISAAGNNGQGGVGVAWGSTFTGVNVFDSTLPIYCYAADQRGFLSALRQMTNFDVVNNSWNTYPDFSNIAKFANEEVQYQHAVVSGRGGLGTIVINSAGNFHLDSNGDPRDAWRSTITVAATAKDGFVTDYSNYGSNILVTAPGGPLLTTDRTGSAGYDSAIDSGNYVPDFYGTSASAPIVSGVATLMLDANASLGWRDVQEILSLSATHTGSAINAPMNTGWEIASWVINSANDWNGGGRHTHLSYGYGMVNAYNAVRMAEAWKYFSPVAMTSANEASVTTGQLSPNLDIADNTISTYDFTVSKDIKMEHVDITLTFSHAPADDLTFNLKSPDGRVTLIGTLAPLGENSVTNYTYTFGMDNYHGELSSGTWSLWATDNNTRAAATLTGLNFTAYGQPVASSGAADVYHYTDEFSDMVALDASRKTLTDKTGGSDWIDASAVHANATIDLAAGTGRIDGVAITMSKIENVVSGDGDDSLTGNASENSLIGMRGNDYLDGGKGDDRLIGGTGNDRYVVDSPDDYVLERIGGGNDQLYARTDYVLAARQSIEVMRMFDSFGTQSYNLTGNALDQSIFGNEGRNVLKGGAGSDMLYGNGGNDVIVGGSDTDGLNGGKGKDTFVFTSVSDSAASRSERDTIADFSHAQGDRIDLSGIDANSKLGRDQAFTFIGDDEFHNKAGELNFVVDRRLGNAVYGDINGDGVADFAIRLQDVTSLTAGDFIL